MLVIETSAIWAGFAGVGSDLLFCAGDLHHSISLISPMPTGKRATHTQDDGFYLCVVDDGR